MQNKYRNRALVSLGGLCPLGCRHCFTKSLHLDAESVSGLSLREQIEDIIVKLKVQDFDIVYVSHNRESFYNEHEGLALTRALWEKFAKDIFIITRMALSDESIRDLQDLNIEMRRYGNSLYLATSVIGMDSYGIAENIELCPAPADRVGMLVRAHAASIRTVLIMRPVFPGSIIPVRECLDIIRNLKNSADAVVASGLVLTDEVEQGLHIDFSLHKILSGGDTSYLDSLSPELVKYVDVSKELDAIKRCCTELGIPFFTHTMPALNHIFVSML